MISYAAMLAIGHCWRIVAQRSSTNVAMAIAAIPSPRPIDPSPSFVVALTLTARNIACQRAAIFVSHLLNMRLQSWRFRNHSRVDVYQHARFFPPATSARVRRISMLLIPRIDLVRIRKMMSDVAFARWRREAHPQSHARARPHRNAHRVRDHAESRLHRG